MGASLSVEIFKNFEPRSYIGHPSVTMDIEGRLSFLIVELLLEAADLNFNLFHRSGKVLKLPTVALVGVHEALE